MKLHLHLLWEILRVEKKKKKESKGAYQKGTDKPPSIIVCNISAYVNGRVVFSAKNAENLHPQTIDNATKFLKLNATSFYFSE